MIGVDNMESLVVCNARENNLKNITVEFPLNAVTCVTGVSGCGKSSLVYDTIFAESKRNLIEGMMENGLNQKIVERPDVDEIINLKPALSLAQSSYNVNPRSTIGTATEISHYLRALFALINNFEQNTSLQSNYFSSNNPESCCVKCRGTGEEFVVDFSKIVPDEQVCLCDGGISFFKGNEWSYSYKLLEALCIDYGIDIRKKFCKLSKSDKENLLYGKNPINVSFRYKNYKGKIRREEIRFEGVIPWIEDKLKDIDKASVFAEISRYLVKIPCSECNGSRLKKEVLKVKICNKNIFEVESLYLEELLSWINEVESKYSSSAINSQIKQLTDKMTKRIKILIELKLGYLNVCRSIPSLSDGERQRVRIARQLNCSLTGLIYLLDEPCKGLHFRDLDCIIEATHGLVRQGNTVIAIEHNKKYLSNADKIIEMGPEGGDKGGQVVRTNVIKREFVLNMEFRKNRKANRFIELDDIVYMNIRHKNVKIPVGITTCLTGVSGAGKSSFARVLIDCVENNAAIHCERFDGGCVKKTVHVDPKPIGKTPRSTVASYLGVYDDIRECFGATEDARKAHLKASDFSVNIEGGRCESCQGSGYLKIDLAYMPNSYIKCPDCKGKRFKDNVLAVRYKGKNIDDVLSSPIENIIDIFDKGSSVREKLQCMIDIGCGYLHLGQLSMNLSGGESQRIKFAKALTLKQSYGEIVYVLDEPTSGLNEQDIQKISKIIKKIQDNDETVIIIEHNLEFISEIADSIVDFGSQGGAEGGTPILYANPIDAFKDERSSLFGLVEL